MLCCAFCWKLVLARGYTWIDNPDLVHMDVPRMQFESDTWHAGEFPLWDPHLWCGQPFLGEIVGAAYPLSWPFFEMRRNSAGHVSFALLNWYYVWLRFLGALFAYWFCRELGTSMLAAVLGGVAFAFSGFLGMTRWPEVVGSVLLGPLVLLFMVRALRRSRPVSSAALAGMFLGLAWLSGHHEIPFYLCLVVAGMWVWDLLSHPTVWRRSLALAAVTFAFVALTSAFQTLPGYEYAKRAVRWVGADHPVTWHEKVPYEVHVEQSFTPSSLVSLILPFASGQGHGFTGVVLLALAVIPVFTCWSDRWVRLLTCMGLGGLLLALGGSNIIHGILYAVVPMFEKARNPNRFLYLFDFGVAILAAFGLDRVSMLPASFIQRAVRWTIAGLAAIILAAGVTTSALRQPGPTNTAWMMALIAALFAAVLFMMARGTLSARSTALATFALVFMELGTGTGALFWTVKTGTRQSWLPDLTQYADVAAFLRAQPQPVRVDAMKGTGAFNFGDWYGIDTVYGFGAGVTSNIFSMDWPSPPAQNLIAVEFTVTKDPPRTDQQLVFHAASGLNVYRNTNAFPRAWIVHRIERATSADQVLRRIDDPGFDGRSTALMTEASPALQTCEGNDQARIAGRTANTVTVDARLSCRGMLILADTWYPGWHAYVDGRPTQIYEPYNALRGVVLEAGAHRVQFRYRPASAIAGGILSLIGVLGACVLAWRDRRRLG
ncbi:MAG TPA: YfhO family protein [Bryobacteraceae bacterium]|nr:YfhO family protein [Bryobacteraceae bacterium]